MLSFVVSTGQAGPAGQRVAAATAAPTVTVSATAAAKSQYVPARVRSFVHSACSAVLIPSLRGTLVLAAVDDPAASHRGPMEPCPSGSGGQAARRPFGAGEFMRLS